MSRGFANAVSPDLGAASAGLANVIELHGRFASFAEVLAFATSVAGVTLPFDTTFTDGHPGGRVTADEDARLLVRQRCAIRVRFGWASVRCSVTIWPAMPQPCMSDLAGPAESKPSRPESMATISRAPISFRQWTHH